MREGKAKALVKLLRPDLAKLLLFIILAFFITILPLYPTHVDRYNGYVPDEMDEFDSSFTDHQSFGTVLYNDYNWTELEFRPFNVMIPQDELSRHYTRDYLDADPKLIFAYIPIFFFAYLVSCYYVEQNRYDQKNLKKV